MTETASLVFIAICLLWLAAFCWCAIARPLGWLAWQAWQAMREPEPNMHAWKGEE